jgi:hypothetical protein
MKQKFYPVICAIVIALTFFSNNINAQSLLIGSYPATSEDLLGLRYRKLNINNGNQSDAVFTGVPNLDNNGSLRADNSFNYGTSGSFNFTITYNTATNTFTTTTTAGSNSASTSLTSVSTKLSSAGKSASANSIDLMKLAVKTHNNNSISVSNLTIDGMPVSGSYGRSNSMGTSNWHIVSSLLNGGFVVSGTVTTY